MDQNKEFEAIKRRHDQTHEDWKVGNWFTDDGSKAHTDRATLITLVEAERARADKAEAELAEAKQALKVQASAIKNLHAAEDAEINVLRKGATDAHRAVATLDSERAMNATLTEENERLQAELARQKMRGDAHWETLRSIRHIARETGDLERIIQWVNDAGTGYVETNEVTMAKLMDDLAATRAELARVREAAQDVKWYGGMVMEMLEEHGPSIVPHLIDTDDNAGEHFRDALRRLARAVGEEG
jgi:chromosome segregation ATPase